jgi:thiol-disulfide isomerase/thioredoxin
MTAQKNQTKFIAIGVAGAIAAIIAVVLVVGGGSSSSSTTTSTTGNSSEATQPVNGDAVAAAEYQLVQAEGEMLLALEDPDNDPARGKIAPVLNGFSFDGAPLTVAPTGKPMLVVFLAHWCSHCNAEVPRLIEWKNSGTMPADMEVFGDGFFWAGCSIVHMLNQHERAKVCLCTAVKFAASVFISFYWSSTTCCRVVLELQLFN